MALPPYEPQRSLRSMRIQELVESKSDLIDELRRAGNTPGLSVCVICNGEIVFQRGYGHADIQNHVAATDSTVLPVASITKGFTAAACGILVADGKLSWSTYLVLALTSFG